MIAVAEAVLHHSATWLALASVVDCDASAAERVLTLFDTADAKAAARAALDALAVYVAESKTTIDPKEAAPIEKALSAWIKANKKARSPIFARARVCVCV